MAFILFPAARVGLPFAYSVASLALVFLVSSCSKETAAPQATNPPPVPVTGFVEMQPRNLPTTIELMAQTEGAKETEVRARVGGILLKRLYDEGTPVKAGSRCSRSIRHRTNSFSPR